MRETPAEGDGDAVEHSGRSGAPAQGSRPRSPGQLTGEKLGHKVELAQALLTSGVSKSKVARDLKISRHSVLAIARRMQEEGLVNRTRVESIKQTFRDKATFILDDALGAVSTRKLSKSSAADCMKVAERAVQMAGLAEKPSGMQGHLLVLGQFNLRQGLPSISALDQASNPPNHPTLHASEADSGTADMDGQLDGERPS